ncbi:hypothetical protein KSS87_002164 [Heliosperma pusillum]|nr:hypothetical protein KSS87_014749 [Heliosperma pusillum]KAH9610169.1 hypothetical protein KSS87_001525 [Heliosperma pusillum]KAH9617989.1 hypothetical protein KSS87_017619 [Heliosperma pusillum]KAH9619055.1 hypothetical protein KSS87_007636 [Heliosperma pusillum]KAH9624966.1 hypothetical protein KSS87_002164 [Heliosperma pusillum]
MFRRRSTKTFGSLPKFNFKKRRRCMWHMLTHYKWRLNRTPAKSSRLRIFVVQFIINSLRYSFCCPGGECRKLATNKA